MAAAVKDYVTSGGWAASYLRCLSRCGRRWRCERSGRREQGRSDGGVTRSAGMTGMYGMTDSEDEEGLKEQLIIVKVSDVLSSI